MSLVSRSEKEKMKEEKRIINFYELIQNKNILNKSVRRQVFDNNKLFNSYINMLLDWAKTHNIISSKFAENEIIENIIDSLEAAQILTPVNDVYDVGSGGGLPGIPLALIYPKINFILVESDRKKCSFLRMVKSVLKLNNIAVKNCRIESLCNLPFIVSKAAFSPKNIGLLINALQPGGKMALWATAQTEKEYLEHAQKYPISWLQSQSYILAGEKKRLIMIFQKN